MPNATNGFKCIVMDPPWPESGGGKIKRGADKHYDLIKSKEEILEVILLAYGINVPVGDGFTKIPMRAFSPDPLGAHLWVWVTNNYLPWGLWLMSALRFKYKTVFTWVKSNEEQSGLYKLDRPGLGQYSMGQSEQLLFGSRGVAMKPDSNMRPRTVIMAHRTKEHSEKPESAYTNVIERISPEPRLEMFSRGMRLGWFHHGNQALSRA